MVEPVNLRPEPIVAPWTCVAFIHSASCPSDGVPLLETLPDPAGVWHVGKLPGVRNVKNWPDVQAPDGVVKNAPVAFAASCNAVTTPVPGVIPCIVVEPVHCASCPLVGVPTFETLPPPTGAAQPDTVSTQFEADAPDVGTAPPLVFVNKGKSSPTSALNAGAAAAPLVGPANTWFAACVFNAPTHVPEVVTGQPVNVNSGNAILTLVTVPGLVKPAGDHAPLSVFHVPNSAAHVPCEDMMQTGDGMVPRSTPIMVCVNTCAWDLGAQKSASAASASESSLIVGTLLV